jgi:hypothetical protein
LERWPPCLMNSATGRKAEKAQVARCGNFYRGMARSSARGDSTGGLFLVLFPVMLLASTFLGWLRGGGAPDVVLKWIEPETSQAASFYVASPDSATATNSPPALQAGPGAEQSLAGAPTLGATVINFRRPPEGIPLANPTTEARDSDPLPAQPTPENGGGPDAVIIATQKLQEAEREIQDMRGRLAQAEWDMNLWRQQAATGFAARDRAQQQVKDVTQQLRQNFLDMNSAQDRAPALQRDSLAEQNRLKELLKLQNACQSQTTRPAKSSPHRLPVPGSHHSFCGRGWRLPSSDPCQVP